MVRSGLGEAGRWLRRGAGCAALLLATACAGGPGQELFGAPAAPQDLTRLLQEMSGLSRSSEITRRLTEERLARIEAELAARVDSTVEQGQDARASLHLRLEDVGRELRQVQGALEENGAALARLRRRLDTLDTQVGAATKRLEGTEQRLQLMRTGQGRMEETLGGVGELQQRLDGLEAQLREASRRLEAHEQRAQSAEQSLAPAGNAEGSAQRRRGAPPAQASRPAPEARAREAPAASGNGKASPPGDPVPATPVPPEEVYQSAMGDYQRGDFDFAIAGFRTYLRNYPETSLAADAHYWLADSYFSLKNYVQAIEEFGRMLRAYPDSGNIPGALLKQGEAYLALGDSRQAAATLCELIRKHPRTGEARLARERNVRCP